jgi:hypothetical protein
MKSMKEKHPEKSTMEQFEIMRYKLQPSLQTPERLYSKLITTCRPVEAGQLACFQPPASLSNLIRALRSTMDTKEASEPSQQEILYTDPKCQKSNRNFDRNKTYPR